MSENQKDSVSLPPAMYFHYVISPGFVSEVYNM